MKRKPSMHTRTMSFDLRRPGFGGRDLPTIHCTVSSKKNEEWGCVEKRRALSRSSPSLGDKTLTLGPKPKSRINPGSQGRPKKIVKFAEADAVIGHEAPYESLSSKWYSPQEVEQFSKDATACAKRIDRTMKYVKTFEASYNASTGLPSPQALVEYLSAPAEIVGVEHLLSSQKTRQSLKLSHAKALLKCVHGGCERKVIAARLRNYSVIAANMAHERAEYVNLLA